MLGDLPQRLGPGRLLSGANVEAETRMTRQSWPGEDLAVYHELREQTQSPKRRTGWQISVAGWSVDSGTWWRKVGIEVREQAEHRLCETLEAQEKDFGFCSQHFKKPPETFECGNRMI